MNKINAPRPSVSKKSPASQLLAAMAALTLAVPAIHAANDVWIGNTDANFATLANWTGSVTPNGNTPVFGTAGTAGTTLNNDISGATYAGLTFNSGASAYTIGGNSFTLSGNITNNSSSLQTINNDMTLSNAGKTFAGGVGGLTLGGTINFSPTANFSGLAITGTVNSSGTLTTVGGGAGVYTGYVELAGNQTLNVTGGTFSILNSGSAPADVNSIVGQNAAGTSTVNVNGGNYVVGGITGFALGNNRADATGVLTITSGTATIIAGSTTATSNRSFISMGRDNATGIINLNGGTLATGRNFVRDGSSGGTAGSGTANFVFGGGTLKALANQTDWLNSATINTHQQALSSVTTTSAASTIDSNGFTVGINNAISGSGGFHIVDSSATTGVVNFGRSSYAYTGVTSVDSGTLNTNAASVTLAGAATVAGGTLTLNGASAGTLALGANSFTMSLGTLSYSLGDQITGTGSFGITGGTLDLTGSISDYGITYTLLNGFTSGSVSGLSITNYDTTNWIAALGTDGVLSFTSAIPEPSTYAALAGVVALGAVALRRRRKSV